MPTYPQLAAAILADLELLNLGDIAHLTEMELISQMISDSNPAQQHTQLLRLYVLFSRAINEKVYGLYGQGQMGDNEFYVLCSTLPHSSDLSAALSSTVRFFNMFGGASGQASIEANGEELCFCLQQHTTSDTDLFALLQLQGLVILSHLFTELTGHNVRPLRIETPGNPLAIGLKLEFWEGLSIRQQSAQARIVFSSNESHQPVITSGLDMQGILGRILTRLVGQESNRSEVLLAERVVSLLQQQFIKTGHWLSAQELAHTLSVSYASLHQKLRLSGLSFRELKQTLILDEACRLLEGSSLTVSAISSHLDFSDERAFRRAFKQGIGKSPAEYRN
ncbi:MAG: helix-turn-helix domain-containing protein [Pseudomonadales bacterium]